MYNKLHFIFFAPLGFLYFLCSLSLLLFRKIEIKEYDLTGNVIVITGANTGIGEQTAKALVKMGAIVVLACRDREKGEAAVLNITREINERDNSRSGKAVFMFLDLNDFSTIYKFVNCFKSEFSHLDILINNAGLNTNGVSAHGINLLFQVNFLSHFLLFRLLQPMLAAERSEGLKEARVVNLSSVMHHFGQPNW